MKIRLLCCLLMLAGPLAWAQQDYFNRTNISQFEFNFGFNDPETDTDLYDFLEQTTNFEADDQDGFVFQFKYLYQINNYVSVGGSVNATSESQEVYDLEFVTEGGGDIFQTFELDTNWIGFETVITPFGSGHRFGSQGWAPKTFVPYLTLGAGLKSFDIVNEGDFVVDRDSNNPDIIFTSFEDDGQSFSTKVGAGLRINVGKSWDINILYERDNAEAELGGDFEGFEDFDLSADSAYIGFRILL